MDVSELSLPEYMLRSGYRSKPGELQLFERFLEESDELNAEITLFRQPLHGSLLERNGRKGFLYSDWDDNSRTEELVEYPHTEIVLTNHDGESFRLHYEFYVSHADGLSGFKEEFVEDARYEDLLSELEDDRELEIVGRNERMQRNRGYNRFWSVGTDIEF